MISPTQLSATEMAAGVAAKEISPVELTEAHLAAIETHNPALNAFVKVDSERALDQARAAEKIVAIRDPAEPLGPLHGVPITIKSSLDVAGLPCETGSKLLAGRIPDSDAPLVERLKRAGAVVLGNTNVPEMLMAYETDNLLYGRTNSPWDAERTPGGSSGGEAAAISACLSAGGIGSDGGGSIRVPAHFSGICGLKPTPGRIPITGHMPPGEGAIGLLGAVGPMTRTVADLQRFFEVIAGPDPGDPFSSPVPYRPLTEDDAKKLKIGFYEDDGRVAVAPEVREAVKRSARALGQRGFTVEPVYFDELNRAGELWYTMFGPGIVWLLSGLYKNKEDLRHPILAEIMEQVSHEPPFTLETMMATLTERDQVRAQVIRKMAEYPILLCPPTSIPAFRHREREWDIDGQKVAYLDAMQYSGRYNLLGFPGVVVPANQSPEGLPVGVQIVARPHEEEQALAVAAVIEQELGGWQPPPLIQG